MVAGILSRRSLYTFACLCIISIFATGCRSTVQQEKESRIKVLDDTLKESQIVLNDLQAGRLPPSYDLHLYLAHKVINSALSKLAGYEFYPPSDPSISISVTRFQLQNYGAFPVLAIQATAKKNGLSLDADISTILIPNKVDNSQGEFQLKVISFTPKLKWWFFETTKSDFVKALLAIQLDSLIAKLPTIKLPVSQAVTFGGPAQDAVQNIITSPPKPGTDGSNLDIKIFTPSTQLSRELRITRYVFLRDGVHIFAVIQ